MYNNTKRGGVGVRKKQILAFDFGASSGRAVLAELNQGMLDITEIHRFSNDPVIVNGTMYWDILRLWYEIKVGITKAVNSGGFDALSIDSWGVDFGVIDAQGKLLGNPVHYRDKRTYDMPEKVFAKISKEELYKRTGIQHMHFNTLYQLAYMCENEQNILDNTDKFLMIPDLFAYFLTGEKRGEITNLSTTNMFSPINMEWDEEIIKRIGIDENILPTPINAGSVYGNILPEICEELGCESVPVIAVGSHDTASAVAACPAIDNDFVYISSGTWSLFGTELPEPLINQKAMRANFTNEIGYGKTIRFLKNIMGLWIIQESRRQWIREGNEADFGTLEREAENAEPFKCFIDVDDPVFEAAGNIPLRIQEYCKKTGQYVPQSRGEIMRCIYDSLAMKYKYTLNTLEQITGRKYKNIHIVGGGIKDALLCRQTADACGAAVHAGPAEATIMGNAAVAFIALNAVKDLKEARELIRDSIDIKIYEPQNASLWDENYSRYIGIIKSEGK